LKEEVRQLQHELAQLNPIPQVACANVAMTAAIRQQQLQVAGAQSAFSPLLEPHPLYSRIYLNKNWDDRSKTLVGLREQKFKTALQYVKARSQMATSQLSDERFENANGDVCCVIFQTIHLEGVNSLQQAYNALLFSINSAEISISERLGHLTVRDDYEDPEGNISNGRLVSTNDDGISTEMNCIMMTQLFDSSDGICGESCGIVVIDSVDEDDLYPYLPSERVRKDVSAAFVLTPEKSKNGEKELGVTLRRAAFVKIHRPKFELSEASWQVLQQDAAVWGEVVVRSIRSLVYAGPL
ncbi:hypothetical protein PHMEG_00028840, partial [Phytophthora megakarya]